MGKYWKLLGVVLAVAVLAGAMVAVVVSYGTVEAKGKKGGSSQGGLIVSGCGGGPPGVFAYFAGPVGSTTLSDREFPVPSDGKFTSLAVNPVSNTFDGPTVITLLIGAQPTLLAVTVPSGSTAVQMAVSDVPVIAGSLVTLRTDATASSTGVFGTCIASYQFK